MCSPLKYLSKQPKQCTLTFLNYLFLLVLNRTASMKKMDVFALNVATLPTSIPFILAVDNVMNLLVARIKHRMGGNRKQHFRVRVQLRHGCLTIAEAFTKYTDVRIEQKTDNIS